MSTIKRIHHALQRVPPFDTLAQKAYHAYRGVVGPGQLKRRVASASPVRVVIGTSTVYEPGWIPSDMQYLNLLNDSHWHNAFADHPIDALLAEHVWEHLTLGDARRAAAQCFKYLRPGGYIRVAVPDGNHPDPEYIKWVDVGGPGPGAHDHRVLYTYESFRDVFTRAGFNVRLLEYYDEAGKFHAEKWDQSAGKIYRCQGWTEKKSDGSTMSYTSIILDATKPVA